MRRLFLLLSLFFGVSSFGQLGLGYTVTDTVPLTNSKGSVVRQAPADLWRCSFASVGSGVLTTDLTLLQTGSGMAVSQSAGNLVITTGTTANSETLIRSVRAFNGAFIARFKTILSQRIANNNFSYELADIVGQNLSYTINSATSVTVTFESNPFTSANVGQFMYMSLITGAAGIPGRYAIASVSGSTTTFTVAGWPASGSGTLMLWGWNYHRALYTSTTATAVLVDVQRKGWASGDASLAINTTASPGHVLQIENDGSMVGYADALVASNAAYQFTSRGSKVENIPDPNDNLYLFIRVLNGTTNPASTTTLTTGFLSVEEIGNNKVLIAGGTQNGANFSLPVSVNGTPAVTVSSGTVTTVTTVSTLTGGNAAEDAATSSNPHIVGGIARTGLPATTVVAGDAVRATMSTSGQLIFKPYATGNLDFYVSQTVTTNSQTAIRAAQGASIIQNVTCITYQNTNATATTLTIQDGNTTLITVSCPASMTNPVQLMFPTPLRGTANTALNYTAGTTGANVLLTTTGYNSY